MRRKLKDLIVGDDFVVYGKTCRKIRIDTAGITDYYLVVHEHALVHISPDIEVEFDQVLITPAPRKV